MDTLIRLLMAAVILITVIATWIVFKKSGRPGWGSIVPVYNAYLNIVIAGKPGWWLLFYFIPFVNLAIHIVVSLAFAKHFGKGVGFGLGLVFLPFIFIPVLAFGEAVYTKPTAAEPAIPN